MFYQLLNLIQVNPERRQNQELPVQIFDLLVQFGHRAQGTGHRAQGAGHRAQSAGHRAQGTEHRAQGLVLQVVQVLQVLQVTYNEAFDHTER